MNRDEPIARPIVVVTGLPRSGTSLMMQMLECGGIPILTDGMRQADASNPRGYYELEAVKRTKQNPNWLNDAAGKSVKVIYKLLYDLPPDRHYQVILMRRPIDEILASQAAMLSRLGNEGASIPKSRLADLFNGQLADAIRFLHQQSQFEVFEVDYHDLIDAPLTASEAVSQFLRQPLRLGEMVAAVDPSLYRQRGRC